jgi:DNA-binding GntR family transcriptional regulator
MTLARQSLADQVRDALRERIASGQLSPGDRVIESQLTREFGVSAIPVREAIRELVAMRLLESATHRGARVREVTLEETLEALEVRAAVEGWAATRAVAALDGQDRLLREMVQRMVVSARRRDVAAFRRRHQSFHRAIVQAAGNRALLRVWDQLAFEAQSGAAMDLLHAADFVSIAQQHEPIVDAIERGDAAQTRELLEAHADRIVRYLRDQSDASGRTRRSGSERRLDDV